MHSTKKNRSLAEWTRREFLTSAAAAAVWGSSPRGYAQEPQWAAEEEAGMFGPWWRGGPDAAAMKAKAPFLRGVFVAIAWSDLEPSQGQFNWKLFDETMSRYAQAGLYIQFMIWVGPDSPRWIYSQGVPEVHTTPTLDHYGQPVTWTYPFYLNETYKQLYWRMLRSVAERLEHLPRDVRARIICVQTAEGTTGDEGGYKGDPLDPQYVLPEDKWQAFKHETWKLFAQLYDPKRPRIHLLMNTGNRGEYNDWLNANMPTAWRKAGNAGHGYQLNDEKDLLKLYDPLTNHPEAGRLIRVRSEMDETTHGWFHENPVWNQYWLNLWGLHFGIDIFQHETPVFEDRRFDEGFRLYAKYGGRKDAASSPGAFCALRDGLDAADFERFPAATFGEGHYYGNSSARTTEHDASTQRTLNIAEAFAARGAKQEDPDKGSKLIMENRQATRMNDVGWNIVAGNYERYLEQIQPATTSLGYWRLGPPEQPYGRFARGTDIRRGWDRLSFRLRPHFADQIRSSGKAKVRIVYLDVGPGEFSLHYDSRRNIDQVALRVSKSGSGRWVVAHAVVTDAVFRARGPQGSDLALSAKGGDTQFHLVEVDR